MTLRARLLLLTSLLIATCVLLVSSVLGYVTWRSLLARVTDEAVLASTLLGQIATISEQAPQEVETMVGDALTTDAYLIAQLVDVAKRNKVPADDLIRRLRDIAARSDIDEIWVADGVGDPVASSFDAVDASIIDDDPIIMQTINKVRTGNAFATVTGALRRGTDGVRMKYAGVGQLDGTGAVLAGRNFARIEELSARLGIKKTLDVILAGRNVEGVWITDEKRTVIASAAPDDVPPPLLNLAEQAMSRAAPVTSLAEGRLFAAAPILDQDGIPGGAAIVSLPTAELRQAIRAFLLFGGGMTAVALAIGFLLASLVARHVSGPVASVIGAAHDVEQRRFVPASLDRVAAGTDELGHLARVFRTMAVQVMNREAELEQLVQARTVELVAKNDALESAQKQMEEELEAAQSLQAAILPQHFEPLPTHAVSAYMMPAKHMGGDFYDAFRIDDHRFGFAIADVAGKGVLAAFFMAVSRNVLRTYGLEGLSPGECLLRANRELCRTNPMELFVTVFYAVLDTRSGEFAYANGGHPDVFLVHGTGRSGASTGNGPALQAAVDRLPRTGGMALGMFDDVAYAEGTVRLTAGDTLFLMTDGISEAMNRKGELFGEEPVVLELARNTSQSLPDLIEHVVGIVHGFVDGAPPSDDITCLALRYMGTGGSETGRDTGMQASATNDPDVSRVDGQASLEAKLAPTLEEIAAWNERVEAFCEAHAIAGAALFHITLIFEELLTNVVNHGGSATAIDAGIELRDGLLHGRIIDDGDAFDPLSLPEPDISLDLDDRDVGGLGVHMVRKLAQSVHYERTGDRNRLLFTLQLGPNTNGASFTGA